MGIDNVHTFLTHPAKGLEPLPAIRGAKVPRVGKLFQMLQELYETAHRECDLEIVFRPNADGKQRNPCRDLVVKYVESGGLKDGRALADRLQAVTTRRSGLGLLFLVRGLEGSQHRLVMARFPADTGIVAHEGRRELDIEFLERVFMKSARSYKCALCEDKSFDTGFWRLRAVDKQLNGPREVSLYWISEFLDAELRSTPAAGSKRLAVAIREAIKGASDPKVREELIAATLLVPGLSGTSAAPAALISQLGVGEAGKDAVKAAMPRPELFDEPFKLDAQEFSRHALYRSVELDNGALLIGDNEKFDTIFRRERAAPAIQSAAPDVQRVRYSTEGRIVSQRLRKVK